MTTKINYKEIAAQSLSFGQFCDAVRTLEAAEKGGKKP